MRKKLFVLCVTLLLTTNMFILVSNEFEVKATPGGGGGSEEDDIGLDFDFCWNVSKKIGDAVYKAYPGLKIIRGREFGTLGEHWSADRIWEFMKYDCGLENVKQLPLGPIKDEDMKCWNRYYTSRMNVTDYLLHIDINSKYYHHDIPVNESFVFPMVLPKDRLLEGLDFNFTLPAEDNIVIILDPESDWPLGGTFTNYSCINLSIKPTNEFDILIGNATYIDPEDPLPDDQEDRVFLFNETQEGEKQLNNVTNATGVLLIRDSKGHQINEDVLANYSYSICIVETSDSNLNKVLEGLENESMIVDNVLDNNTLTFTHNLSEACVPGSDFIFLSQRAINFSSIINPKLRYNSYFLYVWNWVNNILDLGDCKGCIGYTTSPDCDQVNLSHYMNKATVGGLGAWFRDDLNSRKDGKYRPCRVVPFPSLPIFFVNYSIGNCLYENHSEALISGYEDQEYIQEEHPLSPWAQWKTGVKAYNVIGNLTKDKSDNPPDPDDPTVLISNRYDGWWSEAAFDSGCGTGIVLAIAKYFNDSNITPKVNITFLETTGEEFIFRGAQHFSDSNPDRNYYLWIGFDQLATDWTGKKLELTYNDNEIRAIGENISIEHGYPKGTNNSYEIENNISPKFSRAEETVWQERHKDAINGGIDCSYECKTICFCNDGSPFWHRRGEMKDGKFTAGDLMKNIDREDLNDTLELAWNITKYFTVNPDCWFNDSMWNITTSDSEDVCDFNDTVTAEFDVRSILPHDKAMLNVSLMKSNTETADTLVMYKVMNFTVNRSWVRKNVSFNLSENDDIGQYYLIFNLSNSTGRINQIVKLGGNNINVTKYSYDIDDDYIFWLYPYDSCGNPPNITSISATPNKVGFGINVTISANVTSDVGSDIDVVEVIVADPDFTLKNFTMSNIGGDTYEYVFNDPWKYGKYRYWIWAKDENDNETGTSCYFFNVSAMATVSVCTVKDTYGSGEIVNLTDPPGEQSLIGFELLDDNQVLHMWNNYNSYYFNTSNGVQFTNHMDEYWTHNVLMLGYYNNDMWNLIYRTDELSGFNKNITTDDETFVNATLWKDLTYGGYDFRLAIRYYLGVDDVDLTVIPYIKNLDEDDIPYVFGFGWEMNDIQIANVENDNYLRIYNGSGFEDILLSQTLNNSFTDMESNTVVRLICTNPPTHHLSRDLYLSWNEDLTYKVTVKSREGEFNAPVTLFIRIGSLSVGQEKSTMMHWLDSDDWLGISSSEYDSHCGDTMSHTLEEALDGDYDYWWHMWSVGHTHYFILDLGQNLTIKKVRGRSEMTADPIDVDIYVSDNKSDWGTAVATGISSWQDTGAWQEVDNTDKTGRYIKVVVIDTEDIFDTVKWGREIPSPIAIFDAYGDVPNKAPVISDPYPSSGSIGVGIAPLLNITVSDNEGDNMTITWFSNSSGSWQVFGTNNSVGNGTYHQVFSNVSVNGQWWYWNVSVSDGNGNCVDSDVFKFYTGYESKIYNSGNTNISGYLLMQIEFYNESLEEWYVDLVVVNDTSPRIINSGDSLSLDTIFNPNNVNTSSFKGGNGSYRVYGAFRDLDGNVLFINDDSRCPPESWYLEDWYEFTVTQS